MLKKGTPSSLWRMQSPRRHPPQPGAGSPRGGADHRLDEGREQALHAPSSSACSRSVPGEHKQATLRLDERVLRAALQRFRSLPWERGMSGLRTNVRIGPPPFGQRDP